MSLDIEPSSPALAAHLGPQRLPLNWSGWAPSRRVFYKVPGDACVSPGDMGAWEDVGSPRKGALLKNPRVCNA